jgi:GT2 family glycosyltransferase
MIDWNGRCLRVEAEAGSRCAIAIDGAHFVELPIGDTSSGELAFSFSPSGNAVLDLRLATRTGQAEAVVDTFAVEWDKPGLLPAIDKAQPLRPLAVAGQWVGDTAQPMRREVVVVVPVYNASDDVRRCLDSVLLHTTGPSRLIVIDDASTDPAIAPLLQRYRAIEGVEILANPRNLGFTATANRGIALAGRADVVLLNADTEVAANWLTGLRRAACCAGDVATVTAVSDNAGAFSVPELERDNPIPGAWTFAQAARALWQDAGHAYPQLPTGNGFCMYIRREVLDAVGLLDVEAFPQGYGEENDFCQRACAAGYRHLIAGNVLVAHARSRSFGIDRREALGRAGMQILRERWPDYEADVGAWLFSFARLVLNWRVRRIYSLAGRHVPQPKLLEFGSRGESGEASGYDRCMLTKTLDELKLECGTSGSAEGCHATPATTPIANWLQRHAIELIEIGAEADPHVAAALAGQAQRLGIPLLRQAANAATTAQQRAAAMASLRSFPGGAA